MSKLQRDLKRRRVVEEWNKGIDWSAEVLNFTTTC